MPVTSNQELVEQVRQRYAEAARKVDASCCTTDCSSPAASDAERFGSSLYKAKDIETLPKAATDVSLGCGNPTAVADLEPGETVLDLGSGGGLDVLLSAKRVGPTGFAYGVDMTDEMLDLARKNQQEAGVTNVEFLKGYIEQIPLDEASVDVVISNCVINLSADKPRVFAEMYRVLRIGGRLGITDVVAQNELSSEDRLERGAWVGCIAGALSFEEYENGLREAGFSEVEIEPTHAVAEGMHSAIIRAVK